MTGNKLSERPAVTDDELNQVIDDTINFIFNRIKEKGPGAFKSRHEILGCVTEEYHELIDAVTNKDVDDLIHELRDVACSCIFGIASIKSGNTDW